MIVTIRKRPKGRLCYSKFHVIGTKVSMNHTSKSSVKISSNQKWMPNSMWHYSRNRVVEYTDSEITQSYLTIPRNKTEVPLCFVRIKKFFGFHILNETFNWPRNSWSTSLCSAIRHKSTTISKIAFRLWVAILNNGFYLLMLFVGVSLHLYVSWFIAYGHLWRNYVPQLIFDITNIDVICYLWLIQFQWLHSQIIPDNKESSNRSTLPNAYFLSNVQGQR